MSKPFVFSADSHLMEPRDLYWDALPSSLKPHALRAWKGERDDILMGTEHKVIFRMHAPMVEFGGVKRKGIRDLEGRLEDMALDGIDAEICFPQLALWTYALSDPEAEYANIEVYNNWNNKFLSDHLDKFVRCGVLPVRDFSYTKTELKRLAGLGFTAAMLPSSTPEGVPCYNDAAWDEIFGLAGELGVVIVMHTGTGLADVIQERGSGAAVVNYTKQMTDGIDAVTYLVAGGVLDRNPKTQVAIIECGASWLAALAERMDEVYEAHSFFVKPKLSVMPSEIIRRQVKASFQHDKACILSRHITGTQALMWASDYPHSEGTFPNSREVVSSLFEGVEITESEKADILGGNAMKLFGLRTSA